MSRVVSESLIKSQEHDRNYAKALDDADPLRAFRDRFVIDDELVYLDGNSLGRLPRATVDRLQRVVAEQWGRRLIRGWDEGWLELPIEVGDRLGDGRARRRPRPDDRRRLDHGLLLQARLRRA